MSVEVCLIAMSADCRKGRFYSRAAAGVPTPLGHLRILSLSVSVTIRRLLTSIYICVLCSLLLEAASSALLPAKYKQRQSTAAGTAALAQLTVPQASASPVPMPSADPGGAGHLHYGVFNCMFAIHSDITRCNNSYHNALSAIIVRGFRKESNKYRRQFCCGFWARERCAAEASRRKCDKDTYERLIKDPSPYSGEVDTRQSSGISCLGFEQNSAVCSSASHLVSWMNTSGSPLLTVSALLIYYCFFRLFTFSIL